MLIKIFVCLISFLAIIQSASADPNTEILVWLKKNKKTHWLGKKIYYVPVPVENIDSNCHHFSFGNLCGDLKKFNYHELNCHNGLKISDILGSSASDTITQTQDLIVYNYTGFNGAHTARKEKLRGLYWHKFTGLPYVLGFESEKLPNPSYDSHETFKIDTTFGNYDERKLQFQPPLEEK